MKGDFKTSAQKGKKPYLKPEVKQVQLRPEEAVLGGCKTGSMAGPTQAACNVPVNCNTLGTS
jgi:hypothetical protein